MPFVWKDQTGHSLYTPLYGHTFRVLKLENGHGCETLRGILLDWEFGNGSHYEALSYVWGDPSLKGKISVNGISMTIKRNLESALYRLRLRNRPRLIWVDSICINQADLEERSAQVGRMNLIYENAENVNVWLGPATSTSRIGIEVLNHFAHGSISSQSPWESRAPSLVKLGLCDILSRSWFSRTWVVQETAVAHQVTIQCGPDAFFWSASHRNIMRFIRMIKLAVVSPQWQQMNLDSIDMNPMLEVLDFQIQQQFSKHFQSGHPAPDILDFAYDTRHKMCSDPRDRIFGIAALIQGTWYENMEPDYSMSVEETHRRLCEVSRL